MFDPEDKPADALSAPAATVDGDQQGIVGKAEWKEALDILAKTDPAKAAALSKKLDGYDRVLTKKTQELSKREQEIAKVLDDARAATAKPQNGSVGQKIKLLDAQIEATSDPAAREGLRQLKDAIREEAQETIKDLEARWEKRFEDNQAVSKATIKTSVTKDLKALEDIYGEDLIEKYQDQVEAFSLRHPGAHSPDQWLHSIVPADELRQAIRIRLKRESNNKPNGQDASPKPANPAITREAPSSDQYRGKSIRTTRQGFGKAIEDGVQAGMGVAQKLGFGKK